MNNIKNTLVNEGFISYLKDQGLYKILRNFKVKSGEEEHEFLTGGYVLFGDNTIVDIFYMQKFIVPITTNEIEVREYV